jgi:hypothetical protein
MSNYRDRVPCFCRFTGWRSRLSRSNLVAVAVATLHLAKVNYFGPLPSSILAPGVGNFRCAERHFLGSSGAPACQECWHLRSREYPERHFLGDILWLSGRISSKPGAPAFQSAISSERTQAFRAGLVQAFRDRRRAVQVLAFHEQAS